MCEELYLAVRIGREPSGKLRAQPLVSYKPLLHEAPSFSFVAASRTDESCPWMTNGPAIMSMARQPHKVVIHYSVSHAKLWEMCIMGSTGYEAESQATLSFLHVFPTESMDATWYDGSLTVWPNTMRMQ